MSLRFITFTVVHRHLLKFKVGSLLGKPLASRNFSQHNVNKNFQLLSTDPFIKGQHDTIKIFQDESKPLVIMLTWLLGRKRHVAKYYDLYLKRGYNVMTVSLTPWQFFWPITGSQVVAEELLRHLYNYSKQDQQLLLHGFSIGAYLWGEVLVKMNSDLTKYKHLIGSIRGQIWDSAADVTETTKGLPQAMFPKNAFLKSTMEKYVSYHLKTFYDAATQHYLRASQLFHTTPVRCPALIYVSKNDVIGSVIANMKAKEAWDSVGMKTYWKCWEKSRHVSHLMFHREEYLNTLDDFLASLRNVEHVREKIQAEI